MERLRSLYTVCSRLMDSAVCCIKWSVGLVSANVRTVVVKALRWLPRS